MRKSLVIQILATVVVSFQASVTGATMSWPSVTVDMFKSNSTVLNRSMTLLEISLFGSVINVGGLVTAPFCGVVFNKLGRKYGCVFFGMPFLLGWAIISITSDVTMVLIAMALSGIGAGGQAVSPIFIAELAEDSVRGGLSACSGTGYFFGILLCFIIGGYFSYRTMVLIQLSMSVLSIALFMTLKESPVYLVLIGKYEEAAKSLAFYRWTDVSSKEIQTELAKIKRDVDPSLDNFLLQESQPAAAVLLEENVPKATGKNTQNSLISQIKFLYNSKSSKKALFVTSSLVFMSIMMGSLAVQVYAEPLFKLAVPTLPPNMCAIFLAILFLITSLLCVLLVDRCGRKVLTIVSALGSGLYTLLLGTQLQLSWAPHWFSALLIYAYSFVYTLGAATVPFIIMSEVFLPEVRGLCNSIVTVVQWSMNFIGLMLFEMLQPLVGPGPIFYAFSVVCFSCVIFTWRLLPETKGLSVDQIQVAFSKGNK
ncbi:facilitated trehalose transporter Tret1-like isoform X2 [Cydia pomonella]|uniref:facilitated trehalose transporter Tret1-like isoform X2 n=1 Tax=Cydia pomonella TaxID=82600 RepID=UPI002ADDC397|nr:facilitated trehalose transporter Tret1-like isoform X2 [Cydia pomonella]